MNSTMQSGTAGASSDLARHLDAVGWALFFIWFGAAMLVAIPWHWFFLGLGLLILAGQFARWQINAEIESFWVACGVVFLAAGLWTLLNLPWSLGPILLILLGIVLLGRAVISVCRSDDLHRA